MVDTLAKSPWHSTYNKTYKKGPVFKCIFVRLQMHLLCRHQFCFYACITPNVFARFSVHFVFLIYLLLCRLWQLWTLAALYTFRDSYGSWLRFLYCFWQFEQNRSVSKFVWVCVAFPLCIVFFCVAAAIWTVQGERPFSKSVCTVRLGWLQMTTWN